MSNQNINSGFYNIAKTDANDQVVGITTDISNLEILGGANNQVLSTDGSGNLSWVTQSGNGSIVVPGYDGAILFANNGNLETASDFYYDFDNTSLRVPGEITSQGLEVIAETTLGGPGKNITLSASDSRSNASTGGDILLLAGDYIDANNESLGGEGGDILIQAGDIYSNTAFTGGDVIIEAGSSFTNGEAGVDPSGPGGDVRIMGGQSYGNVGGSVIIDGGIGLSANNNVSGNVVIGSQTTHEVILGSDSTIVDLNDVSNLKIAGGVTGQILATYGDGNLYWSSPDNNIISTGGRLALRKTQFNASDRSLITIDWDVVLTDTGLSSILSESGGVFTNISSDTRTFTVDVEVSAGISASQNDGYYVFLQDTEGYLFASQKAISSVMTQSWNGRTTQTVTLAPGETFTAKMYTGSLNIFRPVTISAPGGYGCKINIVEIVGIDNTALSTNYAKYRVGTPFSLSNGINTKIPWDTTVINQLSGLTFDPVNRTFTNQSSETRIYQFDYTCSMGGGDRLVHPTIWFTKNNSTGNPDGTKRYGELNTNYQNAGLFALRTSLVTSWTFLLAPGDTVETWCWNDSNTTVGGGISETGFTIQSGRSTELRITQLINTATQLNFGSYEARQSNTAVPAGTSYCVPWNLLDVNTVENLEKTTISGNPVFMNIGDDRTYRVSYQVTWKNAVSGNIEAWIQLNSATDDGLSRYGYTQWISSADNCTDPLTFTTSATFTLGPNEYFSTWFGSGGGGYIGGGANGTDENYSTRLMVQEISTFPASQGTITGVIAGDGLSGGGFEGTVTLDVDPATTSAIGGVIIGNGLSVAANGLISTSEKFVTTTIDDSSSNTYTITGDQLIVVSKSTSVTIYLPQASANTVGRQIVIKDSLGSSRNTSNPINIVANGVNTIDGTSQQAIQSEWNSLTIAGTSSTSWGRI